MRGHTLVDTQVIPFLPRRFPMPRLSCNWPGCEKTRGKDFWSCKEHWLCLPADKKDLILDAWKIRGRYGMVRAPGTTDKLRQVTNQVKAWIVEKGLDVK